LAALTLIAKKWQILLFDLLLIEGYEKNTNNSIKKKRIEK